VSDSSTIRLHRTNVPRRDRLQPYRVIIDGERIGTVRNDSTTDFTVPPGEHSVQLKIDWSGSPVLHIRVETGGTILLRASTHESAKSPMRQMRHSVKHREDGIDLAGE
jgi:hypothetical protein